MKVLDITLLGLRRLTRDRTAALFMILLPVVITLIIGVSIFKAGGKVSIGVVNKAEGPLAAQIVADLRAEKTVTVTNYTDVSSLRAAVRHQSEIAGVVIPATFDDSLRAGKAVSLDFLFNPVRNAPTALRETLNSIIAKRGGLVEAAQFATDGAGGTFDSNLREAATLQSKQVKAITVTTERTGNSADTLPTGFGYTGPANLVLIVFINSLVAGGILIETRRLGISRRLLGTPTKSSTILLGTAASSFTIAFLQGLLILVIDATVFGVNFGNITGAILIVLLIAMVGTGVAMLVGTLFRTPEQASSVGPPIGIGLGMLSGCMWPLEIVPTGMRTFGHLFPQAWAMDAFIKLVGRGASVVGILPQLLVLLGFAVVLIPIGSWRLRRAIVG